MGRGLRITLWGLVVLLLAATIAAVSGFVYENTGEVIVRVPEYSGDISAPVVWSEFDMVLGAGLVGAFFAGAVVVMFLVMVPAAFRRGFERRRQERFIRGLEGELSALRNLPVTDPAPYEDLDDVPEHDKPAPKHPWADLDDEAVLMAALQEGSEAKSDRSGA